jgi:transcriptional regulator with XRE-family HTH domain
MVSAKMEEMGISIKDLAYKVETTYEHIRRLVRGESVPSKHLLKPIAAVLGLEYRELSKVANADRIHKVYGDVPLELAGKDPSMYPLEQVWRFLTEEHQRDIIVMAQTFAKLDRQVRKAG